MDTCVIVKNKLIKDIIADVNADGMFVYTYICKFMSDYKSLVFKSRIKFWRLLWKRKR